jgi:hypothetical protein
LHTAARTRIRRGNDNMMKNAEIDAKLVKNVSSDTDTTRVQYCLLD